jgi:hypothetical protein
MRQFDPVLPLPVSRERALNLRKLPVVEADRRTNCGVPDCSPECAGSTPLSYGSRTGLAPRKRR